MAHLSFPVGTPADLNRRASNWIPPYRHRAYRAIKKRAAQVTRVLFGCSHCNVTPVTNQSQTCDDCHAWRDVLAAKTVDGRFIPAYESRWRSAVEEGAQ